MSWGWSFKTPHQYSSLRETPWSPLLSALVPLVRAQLLLPVSYSLFLVLGSAQTQSADVLVATTTDALNPNRQRNKNNSCLISTHVNMSEKKVLISDLLHVVLQCSRSSGSAVRLKRAWTFSIRKYGIGFVFCFTWVISATTTHFSFIILIILFAFWINLHHNWLTRMNHTVYDHINLEWLTED